MPSFFTRSERFRSGLERSKGKTHFPAWGARASWLAEVINDVLSITWWCLWDQLVATYCSISRGVEACFLHSSKAHLFDLPRELLEEYALVAEDFQNDPTILPGASYFTQIHRGRSIWGCYSPVFFDMFLACYTFLGTASVLFSA